MSNYESKINTGMQDIVVLGCLGCKGSCKGACTGSCRGNCSGSCKNSCVSSSALL